LGIDPASLVATHFAKAGMGVLAAWRLVPIALADSRSIDQQRGEIVAGGDREAAIRIGRPVAGTVDKVLVANLKKAIGRFGLSQGDAGADQDHRGGRGLKAPTRRLIGTVPPPSQSIILNTSRKWSINSLI
jgi:hypothetical protein